MPSSLPPAMTARLDRLGALLVDAAPTHRDASLSAHEAAVQAAWATGAADALQTVVRLATADLDPGVAAVHRRCPDCDQLVRMHGCRPRTVRTPCGPLTRARPWYHCPACQQGFSPADATLAVDRQARISAGRHARLVRLGTLLPYRQAATLLEEVTGTEVDADTVREHRITAGAALAVADAHARTTVSVTRQAAEPVDPAPGTLLVQTDGVMVRYRDGWHDVNVARVGGGRAGAVVAPSYGAAREPADRFGGRLLAEAARRGALAEVGHTGPVIGRRLAILRPVQVLADGAHGIWNMVAEPFGERIEVADCYHASEHLWTVARAVWGEGTAAAAAWAAAQTATLREQGVAPVRAAPSRLTPPTPEAAAVVRVERGYFATHAARMDDPAIRAQRLPIGSGAVESAARPVIQQRMKCAGQRWSERGAAAMIALRARHASARPLVAAA